MEHAELDLLNTQNNKQAEEIANLQRNLAERNLAGAESDQALAERDEHILVLNKLVRTLDKTLKHIVESKSWKLTKPLRTYRRTLDGKHQGDGDGYELPPDVADEIRRYRTLLKESTHKASAESKYISIFKGKPLVQKPVKLICFYQPETCLDPNEIALSRSCQPDSGTLYRQIELARLYGIEGFCFFYNWWAGKSDQQTFLQNYVRDEELSLPFSLCLHVENQNEASNDAFIKHISQYLLDPRYIKFDNKSLIIVFNPRLLTSAKETAGRWRQWCIDNGLGEIYLAYLQSDANDNPANFGFDAAIVFPPCSVIGIDSTKDNTGKAYECQNSIERSHQHTQQDYTLFRCVKPIRNVTSQLQDKESVAINSTSLSYQQRLFNTINDTAARFHNPEHRFVFIDSWNNSERGAQLEPDQHYGYAYLEATRMALVRKAAMEQLPNPGIKKAIAVVIHAFYDDIFDEILAYLAKIESVSLKLYVTAPIQLFDAINVKLKRQHHDFTVLPTSNRGRDILPFIKIMPEVLKAGHEFLIKIHTKKSIHREDGDTWRKDIFDKLLSDSALTANLAQLANYPDIGILGPADHIVPMHSYMGANEVNVTKLAARLGVGRDALENLSFVAGTMFTARTKAIIPLMNIALAETDFEAEVKQIDGTLAHAFERAFSISAHTVGLTVKSPNNTITENYRFVNTSVDYTKTQE